jgi:C4-dicarboxylate transporter
MSIRDVVKSHVNDKFFTAVCSPLDFKEQLYRTYKSYIIELWNDIYSAHKSNQIGYILGIMVQDGFADYMYSRNCGARIVLFIILKRR